jgi:hypothetical protein
MTDQPPIATATTTEAATIRMHTLTAEQSEALRKRALLAEIRGKWGKFSEQELSDLKNGDDLAAQIAAKYGLDKDIAQRDVTALLKGRAF